MPERSPVLVLAFNRPDLTAQVLEAVRVGGGPDRELYVAIDGPRGPRDADGCREVNELVESITWCRPHVNRQPRNLGCRRGVQAGIDWFFTNVDRGILLEDDTVPDPTFFPFMDELLGRYANDPSVMMISGDDFTPADLRDPSTPVTASQLEQQDSYWFGRYAHIWGWATWRRAWSCNDPELTEWPRLRGTRWLRDLGGSTFARYWGDAFDGVLSGRTDTWDYAWQLAIWRAGGVIALPHGNLVTNLGFRSDATHTIEATAWQSALPTTPMDFPLRHPTNVAVDAARQAWTDAHVFGTDRSPWRRALSARLRRGR